MAINERRGVALDMDGVVIDGMQFHVRAWQYAFREVMDAEMPALEIYLREGYKEDYFIHKTAEAIGISVTDEQLEAIHDHKLAHYDEIFFLDPVPGIQDSLSLMREMGYVLGLVTGAKRAVAERALSEMGVRHWFDAVSGSDEVSRGKPDAEPYQKGGKDLGVTPQNCLVVENAPPGIESAKGAGMICVALETSLDKTYLTQADKVINTHVELQDWLRAEYAISGGRGPWQLP
jgi:HAD superfamily hydrolase (TIGR01509 family)